MPVEIPPSTSQRLPAPAKLRILATADTLFYEDGIRSVGIDRLISESSVTKATFYKHYGSKDKLIIEYISGRQDAVRTLLEDIIAEAPDAQDAVRNLAATVSAEIANANFRGCPFINAAAEFANPVHPVRQIVIEHREAYTERLADLLKSAGHPYPGDAADELMLARDGAMSGGYAGDPIAATAALNRVVDRVLREARAEGPVTALA